MTCDDATWLDLKSEYDLSAMLRALASKGGSSLDSCTLYLYQPWRCLSGLVRAFSGHLDNYQTTVFHRLEFIHNSDRLKGIKICHR